MGAGLVQFSLPPLVALSFVPFLLAQAVLLHPRFSDAVSRPLRFLLMFPALYLSGVAPFYWRIDPVPLAIGANFRWGIFGPNFMMKALEWGLAKDRTPYTWLGFDSPAVSAHPDSSEKSSAEANSTSVDTYTNSRRRETSKRSKNQADPIKTKSLDSSASLPTPPDSPTMQAVGGSDVGGGKRASEQTRRVRFSRNSSRPLDIFLDSLHLLSSMRYHGYAAGPPANQRAPAAPRDKRAFFKRALWRFVRSHIISTTCVLVIIHRHTYLPQYLGTVLPFLSPKVVQSICNALSYFCVGVSLHAQMLVGFEGASMFFLLLSLLPWPSRLATAFAFDAREWTPLFWQPYNITSVAEFWALRWHGLFRKPFLATGFEPTRALVEPVLGKRAARAIGSFVVFALSLWLHDQAFASARWNLPATALRPLSFWERYGAYAFFLGQSVAIVLESAYLSQRRRQISTKSHHSQTRFPTGLLARAWGLSWIVVLGCLAGRSWLAMGLADGLPTIEHWGWQRFVLPTVALAPPPLFTV